MQFWCYHPLVNNSKPFCKTDQLCKLCLSSKRGRGCNKHFYQTSKKKKTPGLYEKNKHLQMLQHSAAPGDILARFLWENFYCSAGDASGPVASLSIARSQRRVGERACRGEPGRAGEGFSWLLKQFDSFGLHHANHAHSGANNLDTWRQSRRGIRPR